MRIRQFALFCMDPQLPESFYHRTEKLGTDRVYYFVRFISFTRPDINKPQDKYLNILIPQTMLCYGNQKKVRW